MARGPLSAPPPNARNGMMRHVSEPQDATSGLPASTAWRTGDVDLAALTLPPDPAAIAAAGREFESTVPGVRPAHDFQVWVDIILAVTGLVASIITLPIWVSVTVSALTARPDQRGPLALVVVVVILGVLLWAFVAGAIWGFSRLRKKGRRPAVWWRLDAVARANGLTYRPWAAATSITTSLVRGRTRFWLEDRLRPIDAPLDLTVATLVIEGDSGNFSVGQRRWGFVELRLDRSMPHIVVETTERSRAESDFGILPGQSFELEGDFPRYARVYADEDARVSALELLTPDVMAAIVDETAGYDLEVRGDRLVIVSPERTDLSDPATLARMFRMAAVLGVEARRVSAQRGDGRYVVEVAEGPTPERMRQHGISRGAIRGFVTTAAVIVVPTIAALVVSALG